jgi:hypothetical protein
VDVSELDGLIGEVSCGQGVEVGEDHDLDDGQIKWRCTILVVMLD